MRLIFSERAWEEYLRWQVHDRKQLLRINGLIQQCTRTAFVGTGKLEPLRGQMSGCWSRRITQEHRLVYRPTDDGLLIAQCRYHY